jgi:hypothetical protein
MEMKMVKRMSAREHERDAEQRGKVATGRPKFARDVEQRMAELGGARRSDLQRDDVRGPSSPLGMGRAKKERRDKL